jgi:hypothetical protein
MSKAKNGDTVKILHGETGRWEDLLQFKRTTGVRIYLRKRRSYAGD